MNRNTCHCDVCSRNWPHDTAFVICPICDTETRPLSLTTDETLDDHILTIKEARSIMKAERLSKASQSTAIRHDVAVRVLHEDLRNWAKRRPYWMKDV